MKNSTKILDYILVAICIISVFLPAAFGLTVATISVVYSLVSLISYSVKFAERIMNWIYKLSFPYTTDEAIILNAMQIVNFFIGKRFQFLYYFKLIKTNKSKKITGNTIFFDDFNTFSGERWRKDFPWGNCNNKPENTYVLNGRVVTEMKKENFTGFWDGERKFINTSGMIFSNNTYPAKATYEARVKFSNVKKTNQAFWLIKLEDGYMQEFDFEYYHGSRITASQHWGANYDPDKHKSDSFAVKVDLSKGWHVLKFKITKNAIRWYINNKLIKIHFLGIPRLENNIIFGLGNNGKTVEDIGELDLTKLPAKFKCDWIKVSKN